MSEKKEMQALLSQISALVLEAESLAVQARTQAGAPLSEVGEVVRKARKEQGLTQQELADLSETSYSTVSKLERGSLTIGLDALGKITGVLGLSLWVGEAP